jgi:hypothetical protein
MQYGTLFFGLLAMLGNMGAVACVAIAAGVIAPVAAAATWGDSFFQLDDLEAALPPGLTGWRGLAVATGVYRFRDLARFHENLH